jgi:hypothetical protein
MKLGQPIRYEDVEVPDVGQDTITSLGQELNAERAREATQLFQTQKAARPGLRSPVGQLYAPMKDQPHELGPKDEEKQRAAREAAESWQP